MTKKRITKKVTRRKTIRRVKKDLSLIPASKATNAYELLDEVKTLILAEPKRYNQGTYITRVSESTKHELACDAPSGVPSCGTIACVAGWVATLKSAVTLPYSDIDPFATKVLGLSGSQRRELFDGGALSNYQMHERNWAVPGTPEYAELGVKHISQFQENYASRLKAKAV